PNMSEGFGQAEEAGQEAELTRATHMYPGPGSGLMPCCGKSPFEFDPKAKTTVDPALVTCGSLPNVVTVDDAIAFLNLALGLDRKAITELVDHRVVCNLALGDHPTIQVGWWPKDGSPLGPGRAYTDDGTTELRVGLLGLLNGLFGTNKDGWGFITAEVDDQGVISGFMRTKPR